MYLKYKEHDTLQVVTRTETRDRDSQRSPGTFGKVGAVTGV